MTNFDTTRTLAELTTERDEAMAAHAELMKQIGKTSVEMAMDLAILSERIGNLNWAVQQYNADPDVVSSTEPSHERH